MLISRIVYIDLLMHAGLRLPVDQRQVTPALPMHLVDVLTTNDGMQNFPEASGNNHSLF